MNINKYLWTISGMKSKLTSDESIVLISTLKTRFEKNKHRHEGIEWAKVMAKLEQNPNKIISLFNMEATGGEPDVVVLSSDKGELYFADCAAESPAGRRSCCYDEAALASRKENKPKDSATHMAAAIGIEILTEKQYRELQEFGKFDLKTSSWVQTQDDVRKLGGALFCDRRYNQVFVYHNGAESYYAARGFRGILRI